MLHFQRVDSVLFPPPLGFKFLRLPLVSTVVFAVFVRQDFTARKKKFRLLDNARNTSQTHCPCFWDSTIVFSSKILNLRTDYEREFCSNLLCTIQNHDG